LGIGWFHVRAGRIGYFKARSQGKRKGLVLRS
jgi:hypothetical protein